MDRQKRFLADMSEEVLSQKLDEHLGIQRKEVDDCKTHPCTHGCLVYGLLGIQDLFHSCHKTAQFYEDFVVNEAVIRNGRKIVVDADIALKLFDERRKK